MSDDQQRHARTPVEGGWQPMPRGAEIDAEGTAFVQLPPELLAHPGTGANTGWAPLAAPGTGYAPPAAASSWDAVPQYPAGGQEHPGGAGYPQGGQQGGAQHQPGVHQPGVQQTVPHQSVAHHQQHQQAGPQQHQGASVPQQAGARPGDAGRAAQPEHDDWPAGPYVSGMVDGPAEWAAPADAYGPGPGTTDTYGSGVPGADGQDGDVHGGEGYGAEAYAADAYGPGGTYGSGVPVAGGPDGSPAPAAPGAAGGPDGSDGSGGLQDTAQWPLPYPPGVEPDAAAQSGSTGQWSVPAAGDDPVDESGEYALHAAPHGAGAAPAAAQPAVEWPAPAPGSADTGAWHQPLGGGTEGTDGAGVPVSPAPSADAADHAGPTGPWSVPAAPATAGDTPDASGEYRVNAYPGDGLTPRPGTDATNVTDTGEQAVSGAWEVVTDVPGAPAAAPHANGHQGRDAHDAHDTQDAHGGYRQHGLAAPHDASGAAPEAVPHAELLAHAAESVPGHGPEQPHASADHGEHGAHREYGEHGIAAAGDPAEAGHEPPAGREPAPGPDAAAPVPRDAPAPHAAPAPVEHLPEEGAPGAPHEQLEQPEPPGPFDAPASPDPSDASSVPPEGTGPGVPADPADPADLPAPSALDEPQAPATEHPCASYVLRVNGTDRPVTDAWIGESLLYVLRERLGLAGAKDGCSQGECGACSVQVDGRLVASCLVPAALTAGSEVRTVEGLAQDGQPSDVQRALADCGAVQCGFCVPGLAMTVHDLLEGNHAPTELETRQAICGNLCRCSGYRGVLEAVRQVADERAEAAAALDEAQQAPGEQDSATGRIPHQTGPHDGGSGKATA
ncbi:2Fe-2S iron-sulfur cluster-binding protein [Streptomyces sp. NPDC021100]|uniref:2Fe-2S iron-sulfur cluster-binding protein n=1 Tax=Streptomyces sp. NPDC021100 TaxID=3365114 RepID=UPI0037A46318